MRLLTLFVCGAAALLCACGGGTKVTRMDTKTTTDLSGRWNDTDSRLVASEMITDCLSRDWLTDHLAGGNQKPILTVGTIRNLTSEHIAMETFISDFERELINSNKVRFVAAKPQREEVRDERLEQQEFATQETAKKMRAELGSDFLLQGAIKTITDQQGKEQTIFYQTDLELINVESMEKVWIGTHKIKKGIAKSSRKW